MRISNPSHDKQHCLIAYCWMKHFGHTLACEWTAPSPRPSQPAPSADVAPCHTPPRLQWPLLLYSDKIYSVFASPTSSGVSGYSTAIKRKQNMPGRSVETSFVCGRVRRLSFTEFNVIHRLCHRIHRERRSLLWCSCCFFFVSYWTFCLVHAANHKPHQSNYLC